MDYRTQKQIIQNFTNLPTVACTQKQNGNFKKTPKIVYTNYTQKTVFYVSQKCIQWNTQLYTSLSNQQTLHFQIAQLCIAQRCIVEVKHTTTEFLLKVHRMASIKM